MKEVCPKFLKFGHFFLSLYIEPTGGLDGGSIDATVETVFELADNLQNVAHTSFGILVAGYVKHLNMAYRPMIDGYQII